MKKIFNIWILIYSLLFSTMIMFMSKTVVGDIFSNTKDAYIKNFNYMDVLIFLMVFITSYIIFNFIIYSIDKNKNENIQRKPNKKFLIIIFILLLICWLPYILTYFPGGLFSDTYYSINMAIGKNRINNHHPILYTLIWKLLFNISKDYTISIFLFTIFQYLFMGFTCTCLIYYMYRKGINKIIIIFSFLYFSLFPLIPFYIISLWKDTLFSIWILIYSVFLLYIFNRKNYIEKATNYKNIIILIIISFFVSFSRNNGIYIVGLTNIIIIMYLLKKEKSKRVKIFSLLNVLNILLIFIIQGPIYNLLNLNVDKKIESLSIPVQQVAYISNNIKMGKKDLKILNRIMPISKVKEKYTPMIVDTLKWDDSFNQDYFNSNIYNFLKIYIKLIFKHPKMATNAYLLQTVGFWNINESSSVGYIQNEMWYNKPYKMSDKFQSTFGFSIKQILNPKIYINYAIFIWIMLFTIFYLLYRKKYKLIMAILPNLFVWLTIMIATPLAFSLRYVFSIVLSLPLYMFCIFSKEKE